VHATNTAMLAVVNPGRPDRPGGADQARALTWEHVDLEAGTVSVWRSVRAHGDTKTNRSRRTLKLPEIAVEALRAQQERQDQERAEAGALWNEHGLVFTTSVGTGYESHNLRRDFRRVTAAAGLGARWVPKELRTSFVSMMSYQGVPVEEIARLGGHTSSRTTEVIYRRELRPVITTGAEVMDQIFRLKQRRTSTATTAG
jgi:integrase